MFITPIKVIVSLIAGGCLAGCGYLGPGSRPPAPGRPDLSLLAPAPARDSACDVQASLAGLRPAPGGVYIDLLIRSGDGLDPCVVGRWLAWQVYYMSGDEHEPGDAFVVHGPDAMPLPLLRPRMEPVDYGHSGMPGYISPVVPGCWMLSEGAAVQSFVFATEIEARPGTYSVRISPWLERLLRSRTTPKGAEPPIPLDASICVSAEPVHVPLARAYR